MRRLSTELVDVVLVRFPAPVADSVRALVAAEGAHERRDRVVECFRSALRTLAAIGLAAAASSRRPTDRELSRLLEQLGKRGLTDGQWAAVLRHALAPWRRRRGECPVPELASLLHGPGRRQFARACDQLLEMRRSETVAHGASGDAAEVEAVLARRMPILEGLLAALVPLFSRYRLAVPAPPRSLMDSTQSAHVLSGETPVRARWRRIELSLDSPLAPYAPVLLDAQGRACLALTPYVVARIEDQRPVALAFLDGAGRKGLRYLELPSVRVFERADLAMEPWASGRELARARVVAPGRGRRSSAATPALLVAAVAVILAGVAASRASSQDPSRTIVVAEPSAARDLSTSPVAEQARRDARLLADAQRALERDPTAALGLLASIDPEGPVSGAARVLAADAVRRGVSLRTMRGHRSWVGALAISQDSTIAVSGGGEGAVRLWDLDAGTSSPLPGHDGAVLAAAISPDGRWIATAGADTTVRLWSLRSQQSFVLVGHRRWVDQLAFSPDSKRLISAGREQTARLWRVQERPSLVRELAGHRGRISAVAFVAGDRLVVSASRDGTLRAWDRGSGSGRSMRGHAAPVTAMVALDEHRVVSGDRAGEIRIWNPVSGDGWRRVTLPSAVMVLAVQDHRVIAGTADGELWGIAVGGADGRAEGEPSLLLARDAAVASLVLGDDGQVAAGYQDGVVAVLVARDRDQHGAGAIGIEGRLVRELRGHEGAVRVLSIAAGRLLSGAGDGTLRLWRADRGDRIVRGESRLAVLGKSGESVIAAAVSGALYRISSGQRTLLGAIQGRAVSVASSADQALAVGSANGVVSIFPREIHIREAHRGPVTALVFAAAGTMLLSAGDDGVVRAWDADTGRALWRCDVHSPITWLGTTARGVVAATWDGRVYALSFAGQATALAPSIGDVAGAAVVSSNGQWLAVAGWNGEVQLINLSDRTHTRVQAHDGAVRTLAFSPDSTRLVTGGTDRSARIWRLRQGALVGERELLGHGGEVAAVAFSADGTAVVTGDGDGVVRVWDCASGTHRELHGHAGGVQTLVITNGALISLARSGEVIWWREALPRTPHG